MHARTITAGIVLLFCTSEAHAASGASTRVMDSFEKCRAIAAAADRADCFDAAAHGLEAAVQSKEITIVDRQEVRTARRSLFGFTLPRIGLFDGGDRDDRSDDPRTASRDEVKEIQTTISSARAAANGRIEFRIADGDALWTTTDPVAFPPKPGQKVRIRKGALGNYFIAIDGQRSVRGMRLR